VIFAVAIAVSTEVNPVARFVNNLQESRAHSRSASLAGYRSRSV
jgi:hypothetical protein